MIIGGCIVLELILAILLGNVHFGINSLEGKSVVFPVLRNHSHPVLGRKSTLANIAVELNRKPVFKRVIDGSERTFSSKDGVAVIPKNLENNKLALQGVYPEMNISQEFRQDEFENYTTTDDHLMHITGMLRDQNGTKYYKVKNSWGTDPNRNANGGYVYFSEAYMRLKAISITVHKDAIPKATSKKLNL